MEKNQIRGRQPERVKEIKRALVKNTRWKNIFILVAFIELILILLNVILKA